MKRLLLALVPWMVTATAAFGQTRPASVTLTYHGLLDGPAYRLGDECYVPLDALRRVGWNVDAVGDRGVLTAEGRDVSVPLRTFNGVRAIALRKAIDKLGGETLWEDDSHLDALAVVKSIRVQSGQIKLSGTLDVKPTVSFFDSPNRIVVDFPGSRLSKAGDFETDEGTRIGQFKDDTVRIVIEAPQLPPLASGFDRPTRSFELKLNAEEVVAKPEAKPVPKRPEESPDESMPDADPRPQMPDDGSAAGLLPPAPVNQQQPVSTSPLVPTLGPLQVQAESTQSLVMTLHLGGPLASPATIHRPEPDVIEITLPGADVAMADGFKLDTDSVSEVTTRKEGGSSVISLKTTRPLGAEIAGSATEIVLTLMKPNVGDGKLAGKIIVVDAGHGGHDNGAKAPDGSVFEKNLTLSFAKAISEKLTEEGATVIMTRKSDVFIPLEERAAIANRNKADFFISVHVNSNSLSNSTSGGITFYHLNNPVCQLLAQSIQHEIGLLSGLPSLGAWSDGRIYEHGFSVLRNSKMPAVLIETGFINHKVDRAKLQTGEFRETLAVAVVRGLKVFLGDGKAD